MNVLQLRSEFTDNGAATQALNISEKLRNKGYNVIFCSSGGKLTDSILQREFQHIFIDELSFSKRGFFSLIIAIFKLKKVLKRHDIDIVHSHNAASLLISNVASLLIFKKIKFFQSVHGIEKRPNYQWRNWIYKIMKVNALFAVSNHTKNELIRVGAPKNKIIVTYNGIDLSRFNITKKEDYNKEIRDEFSIPYNAKIIGIVGRQDGHKGHELLIRSFKELYDQYPDLFIILVGEGKKLASNIKLSKDLGVADRCIFTGLRFDVEKFHAAFNIFTLLSKQGFEMFPCVILESMAYKTPFVATNTTGVPEAAANGEGFICECGDIQCFVQKFKELLDNESLCISKGERGRNSVENVFNIEEVVNKIEKSYLINS